MPCEADVADLASLLCGQHRLDCPAGSKDAIRIFKTNNLVKLHQVHVVGLQTKQRLVNLFGRGLLRPSVDFGHQEGLLSVAVTESFAHANLAAAVVIIPAVVHEGDATVDSRTNDSYSILIIFGATNVIPAQTEGGDLFTGFAQRSVGHFT